MREHTQTRGTTAREMKLSAAIVLFGSICFLPTTLSFTGVRLRHRRKRISRAQDGCCSCFSQWEKTRGGQHPRSKAFRRRDQALRSKDLLLRSLSASRQSEVAFEAGEGKMLTFEEFDEAFLSKARPGGDGGGPISSSGISWRSLAGDVLAQPLFLGVLALLATPAIRFQVKCCLWVNLSGLGLGILGSLPLFAYGLALESRRRDWAWIPRTQETTERAVLKLFGSKRQVTKVAAVSIPLAVLVGFSEECGFRGFLPLLLAAKTGLPRAAIVVLSGIFCGLLHAVSPAYFINATLNGVYFHCLLLSTRNIFVPIVAHAVHNAFALVRCHLKTSHPSSAVITS